MYAAAAAKSLQSCPTLCDPTDGSPPGSTVPGILQARTLEWVAISFSNAWKWKVKVKSLSRVRLFATPWTAAYQAPLPIETRELFIFPLIVVVTKSCTVGGSIASLPGNRTGLNYKMQTQILKQISGTQLGQSNIAVSIYLKKSYE